MPARADPAIAATNDLRRADRRASGAKGGLIARHHRPATLPGRRPALSDGAATPPVFYICCMPLGGGGGGGGWGGR